MSITTIRLRWSPTPAFSLASKLLISGGSTYSTRTEALIASCSVTRSSRSTSLASPGKATATSPSALSRHQSATSHFDVAAFNSQRVHPLSFFSVHSSGQPLPLYLQKPTRARHLGLFGSRNRINSTYKLNGQRPKVSLVKNFRYSLPFISQI